MAVRVVFLAALCLFLAVSTTYAVADVADEAADLTVEDKLEADSEDFNYNSADAVGEAVDEKDVVVLGAEKFRDFVKSKEYVLAEFYAPWCGHCQTLAPEYAKAATILKDEVAFAKIDATEHNELALQFHVEGFPTILFFINGEHKPYTGGRTSDEIVAWLKKKTGPAVTIIQSAAQAEELLESQIPIAVAYLESVEGTEAEEYTAVARLEDGVSFFSTSDAEVAKKFGLDKAPALVLLKKENEKRSTFDGSFEKSAITDFVMENKLPLVITFSRETAPTIFESDVSRQLLLFAHPAEYEKISASYEEAAKSFRRKLIFVLVDLSNEETAAPVLDFFALSNDKTRLMGFVAEESASKYLYGGDFSVASLKEFSEKFLADDLPPYFKSQPAPEKNDEDVKVVVGENFEEVVFDESKDVLLEIYAPWCGHCKSLEPEYNKLAAALKDVPSIVIAKMDGTKNDHASIKLQAFPTILFYPAGKKTEDPIPVDTERTAVGFLKFFKSHAAIPFEAPELPEEPATIEEEHIPEEYEGEADQTEEAAEIEEAAEAEDLKDEL
jgi:protein disulfide-isomerase A1